MQIFKTIYNVLIRMLFPSSWQLPKQLSWLSAITTPIKRMDTEFNDNRDANIYNLSHTSQVPYIEAALNDRYDQGLRRIKIIDGDLLDPVYLYRIPEGKPTYIRKTAENDPTWLRKESEVFPNGGIDFIVQVPAFIVFDTNELKSIVDKYRLAGRTFIIQQV